MVYAIGRHGNGDGVECACECLGGGDGDEYDCGSEVSLWWGW